MTEHRDAERAGPSAARVGVALPGELAAATARMDPLAVATLTVRHLRTACGADGAALYWWDQDERALLPLAVDDPRGTGLQQVFHPGQGVTGTTFATGQPTLSADYPAGVDFPTAWKVAEGVRAVAAVPLTSSDEVYGVLTVTQLERSSLGTGEIDMMRAIADGVSPALHDMRALAGAQFRLAEVRELTSLIRDTTSAADAGSVLRRISALAGRMLGADFAASLVPREHGEVWTAPYGNLTDPADWPAETAGSPLLRLLLERETVVLTRIGDDPEWPLEELPVIAAEGLRTVVALLLAPVDGTPFGSLVLGWRFAVEPAPRLVTLAGTLAAAATSLLTQAKTNAALREREQLWRLTLDNAPVGICLVHLDGTFRLVNAAMCRMLGYDADELVGRSFLMVSDSQHAQQKGAVLERLIGGVTDVDTIQTSCLHADGHGIRTTLSIQLVRDEAGEPAYFCAQFQDVSAQDRQTAQLKHLTTHDSLTGLANRRLFYELLDARLEQPGGAVVALLDVPELRGLDDRFGHLAAGEIVRELAHRLCEAIGAVAWADDGEDAATGECLARFATDEFAAMLDLPAGSLEETVIERLVRAFEKPVVVDGRSHELSVHVGVAVSPKDGGTAQQLLHSADIALTSARREGRPVRAYTAEMGEADAHRQRLTHDLRTALAASGLTLVFQPIVDAASGRLVAAEALARWLHPEFGNIGPDTFVALAEEAALMPALTSWAVDAALAACARWQDPLPGVAVAVNLSASDLQNRPTIELIASGLRRHGVAPELLDIELTETTVMTDLTVAVGMLDDLAELGVGLGIDDFGTGYSSLAYLQRLPMKEVKIDRSFVTNMLNDASKAAIVRMIIQLSRTLAMTTVAEGVEDDATRAELSGLDCDRLQGYGVARPMVEADFVAWAVRQSAGG